MLALTSLVATAPSSGHSAAEEEVLSLHTRRAAYDAVVASPGAHLRELSRILQLDPHHAQYHLDRLERAGFVTIAADGGFTRYYPRSTEGIAHDSHGPAEKRILAAARKPIPLRAMLVLLVKGPSSLHTLAQSMGIAASTLSYHLSRLVHDGVLLRQGEAQADRRYAVADPALVEALLIRHPPRRSLIGDFVDLWDSLALPPRGQE